MGNLASRRDPADPDPEILAVEVIQSFALNPSASVRIVCFHSGQDVHDFADKMETAKRIREIPSDITVWTVVFSGANPKQKVIEWGMEKIEGSRSIIIPATDYYRDLAREVLSRKPQSKVLFFGYQGGMN